MGLRWVIVMVNIWYYDSVTMDSEKNESLKSLKYVNVQSLTADLQA